MPYRNKLMAVAAGAVMCAAAPGAGAASAASSPSATAPATLRWGPQQYLPQPPPGGHAFAAVSCPTTRFCMAVGASQSASTNPGPGPDRPLVETYDGSRWTVRHPITPAATDRTTLAGVSCPTATDCTVVGSTGSGNIASIPLAETWNATTRAWRVEDTVNPSNDSVNRLFSVSCPSTSSCTAVGAVEGGRLSGTLREQWRAGGGGWRITAGADAGGRSELYSVSCVSSRDCVAVGAGVRGAAPNRLHNLAERWNGTTWTTSVVPSSSDETALLSVSCTGPTSCMAVGDTTSRRFSADLGPSGWTLRTLPGLASSDAVTCVRASSCVAVGLDARDFAASAYWNGSSWTVVQPTPLDAVISDAFVGVACPSASDCVAVGNFTVHNSNVFAEGGRITG